MMILKQSVESNPSKEQSPYEISIEPQIVVLNEEQFEDIIYRTVSRCLNEKNIGNLVEKPEDCKW